MRNPYDVLGLQKGANEAEVKKAFRRAAKLHHPDQNQNDPQSTERFAEVNGAYEILGDTSKRGQFDRGEIDAAGKPKFQGFGGGHPGSGHPGSGHPGSGHPGSADDIFRQFRNMGGAPGSGAGGFDASDIFGRMFNETAQRSRGPQPRPQPQAGADAQVSLSLTLEDIASGEPKRIRLPTGRDLDVAVPKNISDGMTVRLRNQGYSSPTGGEPGDAMLTIRILPHERFTIDGSDLRTRLPVSLEDAVLGGLVIVPTLGSGVEMAIPAMTSGGRTFRLKGKGMPGKEGVGDLYATVDIVLPKQPDAALTALMRQRKGLN